MTALVAALVRLNRAAALLAGGAILATAAFILLDITLRRTGGSFGGTDEISGYVMAAVTTWGFGYALTERAHIRIDVIRGRLPTLGRLALDLVSLAALASVAVVVAWRAWPVVARSIQNASRANTPLETPLVIPQSIWFAGLVWFAIVAVLLLVATAVLVVRGRLAAAETAAGPLGDV